jgi:hypothetical protein
MQYHDLYQHMRESRERLAEQFKEVPSQSPANSIAASYAAWNRHSPRILATFRRLRKLAEKVQHTEYEWARKVTKEMQIELDSIRLKLAECELGSPPEQES